jgi:L-asparaginase
LNKSFVVNHDPETEGDMAIRIFVTGGTFDKEYHEVHGKLYFNHTHLYEMLDLGRCKVPVKVRTLMMMDSLDMTDVHRRAIVKACREAREDQIVITHGTDTMELTAKSLTAAKLNKTIVLTGAIIPYKFHSSDGLFNLGSALAFVQALPPGVYVGMNGRYFMGNNVRKNRRTGKFEEVRRGR